MHQRLPFTRSAITDAPKKKTNIVNIAETRNLNVREVEAEKTKRKRQQDAFLKKANGTLHSNITVFPIRSFLLFFCKFLFTLPMKWQ